jgi:hypothetical protein
MKYLKLFESFSLNEESQTIILTDDEKNYVNSEIESLERDFYGFNLFEYYKNGNGFHIQCMPIDTKKNTNPVTIECEKESDGKLFIQYSQESDYDSEPVDKGFTEFPEKVNTLEEAMQEIKKFFEKTYKQQ